MLPTSEGKLPPHPALFLATARAPDSDCCYFCPWDMHSRVCGDWERRTRELADMYSLIVKEGRWCPVREVCWGFFSPQLNVPTRFGISDRFDWVGTFGSSSWGKLGLRHTAIIWGINNGQWKVLVRTKFVCVWARKENLPKAVERRAVSLLHRQHLPFYLRCLCVLY